MDILSTSLFSQLPRCVKGFSGSYSFGKVPAKSCLVIFVCMASIAVHKKVVTELHLAVSRFT